MKIQCPKCSVRFLVPDAAVTPGRKFRCSVCKDVFTLEETAATPAKAAPPKEDFLDELLKEDDLILSRGKGADVPDPDADILDDFDSFMPKDQKPGQGQPAAADLDSLLGDQPDNVDLSAKADAGQEEPADLADFNDFLKNAPGSEASAAQQPEPEPYAPTDQGANNGPAQPKKPSTTRLMARIISLLIILAIILVIGMYLHNPQYFDLKYWTGNVTMDSGSAATSPAEEAAAPAPLPPKTENMTLKDIRQYTVDNKQAGLILVIDGAVRNDSGRPRQLVYLEASLFNSEGKDLDAKKFFAGTSLTIDDLTQKTLAEIEQALTDKAKISENNSYIEPDGVVKFMVVFPNAGRDDVAEYGLKIIGIKDLSPEDALKQ